MHQQDEMHRTGSHHCPNRIVSIFQPHVRPIVRGKAGANVEFGAKTGMSVVEGYNFIDHHMLGVCLHPCFDESELIQRTRIKSYPFFDSHLFNLLH